MIFILEDQIEEIFILPTCQKQQQQQRQNSRIFTKDKIWNAHGKVLSIIRIQGNAEFPASHGDSIRHLVNWLKLKDHYEVM